MEILTTILIVISSLIGLALLFGFIIIAVGLNAYFKTEEGIKQLTRKGKK